MWQGIAVLTFVTLQRLIELALSQRNTKRLLARGAFEVAPSHYPFIVTLHAIWLVTLWMIVRGAIGVNFRPLAMPRPSPSHAKDPVLVAFGMAVGAAAPGRADAGGAAVGVIEASPGGGLCASLPFRHVDLTGSSKRLWHARSPKRPHEWRYRGSVLPRAPESVPDCGRSSAGGRRARRIQRVIETGAVY